MEINYICSQLQMVVVAQLVRALVCGTRSRRFEPGLPPRIKALLLSKAFFVAKTKATKKSPANAGD